MARHLQLLKVEELEVNHRVGAWLLAVLGVLTLGTGIYFMAVRPPLLPEDLRFTAVNPALLPPQFGAWLQIVFRTWGGFVTGFAIVLLGIAMQLLTGRNVWLRCGVALGLFVAFGRFLASNILLRSEYLWFIGLLFVLAAATAVLLLWPPRVAGPR